MAFDGRVFRVALTADFYDSEGACRFRDMGLALFDSHAHIQTSVFDVHRPEIGAEQVADVQGVVVLTPAVTAETVSASEDLLAIVRFGVGYDSVDVGACTEANVVVLITAGAVDRSVAEATVGWMIALTHHMRVKDRLVRTGGWDARTRYMGSELRDRTFGAVGLGGIARETVRLLGTFGMNPPLAFDPYVDPDEAGKLGVALVSLQELMAASDFVSVHCPLTRETEGLIGRQELSAMKRGAYLINTARGGIVDEDALFDALETGAIAGAALDCFAEEPVVEPQRFGKFDNVLLAPHSVAWTGELFRDIGRAACRSMVDLSLGTRPHGVVNPEVFRSRGFQEKWSRLCSGRIRGGQATARLHQRQSSRKRTPEKGEARG
ncbi:MAG: dehydrogenase [Candidatus Latescibacteria bacterium]|nr:dehydrogenase [Candidatus Latescibacterota bacterium]